jgi:hypothetical protein
MLWLATAAIAASTPLPAGPAPAVVQATAMVRIVSGVRLKLDSVVNEDAPRAHETKVTTDGIRRDAQLIEFE